MKKITVVDDNESILDSIELMLSFEGFQVQKYSYGSEMLEQIDRSAKPDLILMDMWLSGEDGSEICKLIKADKDLKTIPVIMMSASRDTGKSVKESGADYFISKPFDISEMIEIIKKYTA